MIAVCAGACMQLACFGQRWNCTFEYAGQETHLGAQASPTSVARTKSEGSKAKPMLVCLGRALQVEAMSSISLPIMDVSPARQTLRHNGSCFFRLV